MDFVILNSDYSVRNIFMRHEKTNYMVFAFHTTTSAFALEKYCQKMNISGRLIPVPRQISAGCGIAYRMPICEYDRLPVITENNELSPDDCWTYELSSRDIEVETVKMLLL